MHFLALKASCLLPIPINLYTTDFKMGNKKNNYRVIFLVMN
jgi:hypothetical protein